MRRAATWAPISEGRSVLLKSPAWCRRHEVAASWYRPLSLLALLHVAGALLPISLVCASLPD